jgi:hypothetical protein
VRAVCNLSVYMRVNRQYKHNLSCTVHDYQRLYRQKPSVGILQRVAKYLLQIPQSLTSIPTYTVSLVFYRELQNIYWKSYNHWRLYRWIMYSSTFYIELKNIYWKYHNHRSLYIWITSVDILLRVAKYLLEMS